MKATGIVRRIDDLGRVVVPKEIRRTLRIREGDPLEIFVDREKEVILKKYSPFQELTRFSQEYTDSLNEALKQPILVYDRDVIVASSGFKKKEYTNKPIPRFIETLMLNRESDTQTTQTSVELYQDQPEMRGFYHISPIVANGDAVGAILAFREDESLGDEAILAIDIAANFLGKQME
ncbi:transcriptional regulator, AbrB family [Pelagirhabdus alkalitolerans]|uniref:Transcriptional regulator, AbrB family n=1 Tax=Pelagirhabdus alkalitolerans TaxID=1612202 RepID=A0A1G6MIX7_9BACI|nr:stage V sporulation T C-terminal domain-containing protein [Pelagirhabdus alkalitolerans]SDC55421.1 transcriptional regulator, AbrB family [Pelagirhabdus alkalitolerans]